MPITNLPTPPTRNDPTNFADRGDTFLAALPLFATEANALEANVNEKEASTIAYAVDAYNSKTAAVGASNAIAWVSGTAYTIGNVRWSPTNYQSYRRKTNGSGTTDPMSDSTNWAQLTSTPSPTGNAGKYLGTDGTNVIWSTVPDISAVVVSTTAVNATAGLVYLLTNTGVTTVTLPATPLANDKVIIVANNAYSNIISRNGSTIMGVAEDVIIDTINITVRLQYINSDWKIL